MAEQDDNWFGSWISAAKDKSSQVLEFVKKDLEEFGSAVKTETNYLVSSTGNAIEKTLKLSSPDSTASTVKRSFSSFLGQMNTVLNPSPDDSDAEAILIVENSDSVPLTKLQQLVYELQKSADTFTQDPEEKLRKKYDCWLEIIDDQLSDDRINKHVKGSTTLLKQYESLVPESVSHTLFWKRYLFKKALLEDEVAHEEAMEKRDLKEQSAKEEKVTWDKEDFAPYIDLTEEEQIKLLEEYENEIKTTKDESIKVDDKVKEQPVDEICDKPVENNEKIANVDSAISLLDTTSSNSSTDGDWEKISDDNNDK